MVVLYTSIWALSSLKTDPHSECFYRRAFSTHTVWTLACVYVKYAYKCHTLSMGLPTALLQPCTRRSDKAPTGSAAYHITQMYLKQLLPDHSLCDLVFNCVPDHCLCDLVFNCVPDHCLCDLVFNCVPDHCLCDLVFNCVPDHCQCDLVFNCVLDHCLCDLVFNCVPDHCLCDLVFNCVPDHCLCDLVFNCVPDHCLCDLVFNCVPLPVYVPYIHFFILVRVW